MVVVAVWRCIEKETVEEMSVEMVMEKSKITVILFCIMLIVNEPIWMKSQEGAISME